MTPGEIAHIAESIELRKDEAFWGVRPVSAELENGSQLFKVGGALVTVAPGSVSLQRNRVLGLGVEEPAAGHMIDQVLDLYRAFKVKRFSFHRSPCPQFDLIGGWLANRAFEPHHCYSSLFRDTRALPRVESEFRVRRAGKADAARYASVFAALFTVPPGHLEWVAASIGAPGFNHYLAMAGERPVGIGMVYVEGDRAWMGQGGTLTPFRRRGGQAALIAARVRRAAELGAGWVTSVTLEPRRGRPSGSYRNLLKYGFREVYQRPIWMWDSRSAQRRRPALNRGATQD
jgi:hypothetical protein